MPRRRRFPCATASLFGPAQRFSLPVAVAEREGFFLRQGLNFRVVVPIPGGSDKMIDALHDDTCNVTHVATPFLVRAALAGSDAVAVAAEFNNPIYSLVARPEIKTYGDLKDKLLGSRTKRARLRFPRANCCRSTDFETEISGSKQSRVRQHASAV